MRETAKYVFKAVQGADVAPEAGPIGAAPADPGPEPLAAGLLGAADALFKAQGALEQAGGCEITDAAALRGMMLSVVHSNLAIARVLVMIDAGIAALNDNIERMCEGYEPHGDGIEEGESAPR